MLRSFLQIMVITLKVLLLANQSREDYTKPKKSIYIINFTAKLSKTNSCHHQAIKKLADGFRPTLFSIDGKYVEGIEHADNPYFTVQFHPEKFYLKHKLNKKN